MRKLNHQFEAQVWYDPEEKMPPAYQHVQLVVENTTEDRVYITHGYAVPGDDGKCRHFVHAVTHLCFVLGQRVLAWTAWSPEYLFEPVDVHAPIRGIVKESNRGGKNTWN